MDDNGSVDEDDPEHLCLCLVSSGENISLPIFRVRVLMQRVQLLTEASTGMPSCLAMIFESTAACTLALSSSGPPHEVCVGAFLLEFAPQT